MPASKRSLKSWYEYRRFSTPLSGPRLIKVDFMGGNIHVISGERQERQKVTSTLDITAGIKYTPGVTGDCHFQGSEPAASRHPRVFMCAINYGRRKTFHLRQVGLSFFPVNSPPLKGDGRIPTGRRPGITHRPRWARPGVPEAGTGSKCLSGIWAW